MYILSMYSVCASIFQITVAGFKYIATGCTSIHSLIVNEFPTLDDEAMEVSRKHAFVYMYLFIWL